jgi:probable F420-dependent oxidoreductase
MRLGISLPTAGTLATTDAIAQIAEGAERIGLDSLWTFERLLAPTSGAEMNGQVVPLPEEYAKVFSPLEVLAFAAARTSTITLGTSILVAPLHNPAALGRSLATVDQLSNGRVVLGLGQGWMRQEFEAAGVSMARRGPRFAEFVAALRAVWGPDPVAFDGEFYTIAESNVGPKPVQAGGPSIIVGSTSPAGIQRTAGLGLGLNPIWFGDWEALEGAVQAFRIAADKAGHDVGTLPVVLRVNASIADEPTGEGPTPSGSPEQIVEAIPRLERIGVTELFWTMSRPVDEQLALAERLVQLTGRSAQ